MAGAIISLALVLTYLAYVYAAWHTVRKSNPVLETSQRELSGDWTIQNEIPHARLSHFAWQLARATTQSHVTSAHTKGHSMFFKHLRTSAIAIILFTIVTGVLYPLLVTGIAQLIFPDKANGSLLQKNGKTIGSELIGQPFSSAKYFWSRPSATRLFAYNAAASSGSNYGPLSPALLDVAQKRIKDLKDADPLDSQPIPVDLVTASGSGLDPHISVAAALYQLPRVARSRDLSEGRVRSLMDQYTEERQLGFLGEPRVNVFRLNFALDDSQPQSEAK
jgi:potassium-transporting ATPase KdpC subunit